MIARFEGALSGAGFSTMSEISTTAVARARFPATMPY